MPSLQIAANLLFLPLLGGYLLLLRLYRTRYVVARTHGPRLLLHSSVVGLLLIAGARGLQLYSTEYQHHGAAEEFVLWTLLPTAWVLVMASLGAAAFKRWVPLAGEAAPSDSPNEESGGTPPALASRVTHIDWWSDHRKEAIGIALVVVLVGMPLLALSDIAIAMRAAVRGWTTVGMVISTAVVAILWRRATEYMADISWQSMALRSGLFLIATTLALVNVGHWTPSVEKLWKGFLGSPLGASCAGACPALGEVLETRGLGLATAALALGLSLPWALNLLMPRPMAIGRFYRRDDVNSLERLLFEVSTDWDDGDRSALLQITCNDNKVYVGYIRHLPPDPSFKDAFLEILPVYSGYRDKDTRKVAFTTIYDEFFEWLIEDDSRDLGDYFKVIPISTICSASRFDLDVFLLFQGNEPQELQSNRFRGYRWRGVVPHTDRNAAGD